MSTSVPSYPFRVLHCLRAPVGGLFRHVCDLARAQSEAGYEVGVICADEPSDKQIEARLEELETYCNLGVTRIALGRMPGISDIRALMATAHCVRAHQPNVLHGHGAKGGVLARWTPGTKSLVRIYTPHGGSIHYASNSPVGMIFGLAERLMLKRTDGLILESDFARSVFEERFGKLPRNTQVVHNGLSEPEFEQILVREEPADFLFLGEVRELKGIFTLLEAIAGIASHRHVTVDVAGDGPDMPAFTAEILDRDLSNHVSLLGKVPAREAFTRARAVLLPSHHDSFPYVALEAAAAGRPLIATATGGVPEIFGPCADLLIKPGDARALQKAMESFLEDDTQYLRSAEVLRAHVGNKFSLRSMANGVSEVYAASLEGRAGKVSHLSTTASYSKLDPAE